jgi:hypothetical protein
VQRLFGVTVLPLAILTHVQEHGGGIRGEPGAGLIQGDFVDARAGFVHDFQKSGRMIHARRFRRAAGTANHFFTTPQARATGILKSPGLRTFPFAERFLESAALKLN